MSISGKYLEADIGDTAIDGVQEWEADETCDPLDGQTGADDGYDNDDFGSQRVEVRMNIVQDTSTGVYTAVRCGTEISNLKLYRDKDDALPAFDIDTFRVFQSGTAVRVKDKIMVPVRGRSCGSYTVNDPGAE